MFSTDDFFEMSMLSISVILFFLKVEYFKEWEAKPLYMKII